MKKMTFTLDDESARTLERVAYRLSRPKSQVVREAIRQYAEASGRLTDEERSRALRTFARLVPRIPDRPRDAVEAELEEVREARRHGGRGSGGGAVP